MDENMLCRNLEEAIRTGNVAQATQLAKYISRNNIKVKITNITPVNYNISLYRNPGYMQGMHGNMTMGRNMNFYQATYRK